MRTDIIFYLLENENGQALAEYALILGLVFIVCVSVLTKLGLVIRQVLYPNESQLQEMFGG